MLSRRHIIAWNALATLLAATFYAPLFHVHADEGEAAVVHAHLPELELSDDESVVHMEAPHSHAAARSIDILITIAGRAFDLLGIIPEAPAVALTTSPSRGFVPTASPRAHAPPALRLLPPRSPPA
jgi:hypothetical protein